MSNALMIDFGSTYTKTVAVNLETERIMGTSQAATTVEDDITIGLDKALEELWRIIGKKRFTHKLACSSAAGGLRMVAVGFVKELTSEAANRAALGAGSKVIDVFSYGLDDQEVDQLIQIDPDIILMAGGTDGGNKDILIHNARQIANCLMRAPVVLAGNRKAVHEASDILRRSGKQVVITENVMPEFNRLNVEPAREAIRQIFMRHIVFAKGFEKARAFVDNILMPTPMALLNAAELLAEGTEGEEGFGELVIVDVGGATTDIHSVTKGAPTGNAVLKGLPEPYAKRTVEGDLGIRYNALNILDKAGVESILKNADLSDGFSEKLKIYLNQVSKETCRLPGNDLEAKFDMGTARTAIEIAMKRHAGIIEKVYVPDQFVNIQTGKDLTDVKTVIGTGGVFVHGHYGFNALQGVLYSTDEPLSLRPKRPDFYCDSEYVLFAIGLLAGVSPDASLRIAKGCLGKMNF